MQITFLAAWNTGAWYSEERQRIAVWRVQSEVYDFLLMRDFDRNLHYAFVPPAIGGLTADAVRGYVMKCYLHNFNVVYPGPVVYDALPLCRVEDVPFFPLKETSHELT